MIYFCRRTIRGKTHYNLLRFRDADQFIYLLKLVYFFNPNSLHFSFCKFVKQHQQLHKYIPTQQNILQIHKIVHEYLVQIQFQKQQPLLVLFGKSMQRVY